MQYSPSLAGRKAVSSDTGIDAVAQAILQVVHPQQSPLIIARDTLLAWELTPPVITDQYWLEVTEASNRVPGFGPSIPEESTWARWSFPLPEKGVTPDDWGLRLAWTAMQMNWVRTAEETPITPLTDPNLVLQFIDAHPGLLETCEQFPSLAAEYAPQITLPGMGGRLEPIFEKEYQQSLEQHAKKRHQGSTEGSGLTTNSLCPLCDEEWALRHPTFGDYKSVDVAYEYFHGGVFGPLVSPYKEMDHTIWLLSRASDWLPKRIHDYLLDGMANGGSWVWGYLGTDHGGEWSSNGALHRHMRQCYEKSRRFTWTQKARQDAVERIGFARDILSLPESPEELFDSFVTQQFPDKYISVEYELRGRRSGASHRQSSTKNGKAKTAHNQENQ